MPGSDVELPGFAEALPLYGKVRLAQQQFERALGSFLAERVRAFQPTLEEAGVTIDEPSDHLTTIYQEGARWLFVEARVRQFPGFSIDGEPYLRLALGWRREPESDRELLPYAFLEFLYNGLSNAGEWKTLLERLKLSLPLEMKLSVKAGWAILYFHEDEHSLSSLEAVRDDIAALAAAFARALRAK